MSTATERARGPVTLRLAREEDREALRRLAELDSSTVPPAPTMVADLDGELLAAVSIADGATVADPFAPTADLVDLLRLRVGQLQATVGLSAPLVGSGWRSLVGRTARVVGLLGEGEERRAAAYGMSGSQALVAQRLAHGRRRG